MLMVIGFPDGRLWTIFGYAFLCLLPRASITFILSKKKMFVEYFVV